ncbi:MAG: hypothetical protein BMS9Abin11_1804 [Gammaproteobacteria bacterium]|nr:MAG: hypothetical protein BMS9Abin11_1804 [Gammaproteobacteria bacterium]
MIDILVIRDAGNRQGDDVVDPMITSIPVALDRGRFEINEASGMRQTTLETVYRNDVEMGQIVEVHDSLQGKSWRGKISSITHTSSGAELITKLNIMRPR